MVACVRLFSMLRERAGADRLQIDLPAGACAEDVRRLAAAACPALAHVMDSVAVAVNLEVASPGQVIHAGDEIALLPPVSGG